MKDHKKYDWKCHVARETVTSKRLDKALIIMHAKAISNRKKGIIPKIYNEEDKIK